MQTATNMNQGLDEFLGHIRARPSSDKLVDRYMDLVAEMGFEKRHAAMAKLVHTLLEANPHRALESSYKFLQSLRHQDAPKEQEVSALELAYTCFEKLGKLNHASVVQDEINRLSGNRPQSGSRINPHPQMVQTPRGVHITRDIALENARHGVTIVVKDFRPELPQAQNEAQPTFDSIGVELFEKLEQNLGNFMNTRHQQLAVETLIKSYFMVYEVKGEIIRSSLERYGRNPLIWSINGKFRENVTSYFMGGRLFSMGRDKLSELKLRTCLELLTSWFDQKIIASNRDWIEMSFHQERSFLETTLNAILDKEV